MLANLHVYPISLARTMHRHNKAVEPWWCYHQKSDTPTPYHIIWAALWIVQGSFYQMSQGPRAAHVSLFHETRAEDISVILFLCLFALLCGAYNIYWYLLPCPTSPITWREALLHKEAIFVRKPERVRPWEGPQPLVYHVSCINILWRLFCALLRLLL